MTDYATEFDRILVDYRAGARGVREQFLKADARTARGGADVVRRVAGTVAKGTEAGRVGMRAAERRQTQGEGRDAVVMPSDWTDEDEAMAEAFEPPESWLR